MLQAGIYRAQAHAAVLGYTKNEKPQIAVTFSLLDWPGEFATWYGYFTDKTEERTFESLRLCGWRGIDLDVFTEGNPLPADMTSEVMLTVEHDTYEGKTRAKVAWVNAPGGGAAVKNAATPEQAKSFAATMRAKLAAYDRTNTATVTTPRLAPSAPSPAPEFNPDEIPF